jgi:cytochrome c-type biogenesis protein
MGGRVTNTVAAQTSAGVLVRPTAMSRISTLIHGVMFVAGFTFVFVVFGLLTTAFVRQVGGQNIALIRDVIGRVGGIVIIFFGLHFMGVMPALIRRLLESPLIHSVGLSLLFALIGAGLIVWATVDLLLAVPLLALFGLWLVLGGAFSQPQAFWTGTLTRLQQLLYADTRRQMIAKGEQSYASSALMGIVFAAGWTPCIGPIYGSILTLAATGSEVGSAGAQMIAYSLGLGVPFLLTALMLDGAQAVLRRIQQHLHKIELVSGAFLVLIGVLIATGRLQQLSQNFANQFAEFSYRLEECVTDWTRGELAFGSIGACMDGTSAEAVSAETAPASIIDLAAQSADAAVVGTNIGEQAPNFATTTDAGEPFQLSNLRGQVVLLNFWATWCGPCRIEMPAFEQAYQRGSVTLVGVNNGETAQQIADFRAEYSLTFPLALDVPGDVQRLYGILSYPTTFLIDRNGIIRERFFGALTEDQLDALLNHSLITSA